MTCLWTDLDGIFATIMFLITKKFKRANLLAEFCAGTWTQRGCSGAEWKIIHVLMKFIYSLFLFNILAGSITTRVMLQAFLILPLIFYTLTKMEQDKAINSFLEQSEYSVILANALISVLHILMNRKPGGVFSRIGRLYLLFLFLDMWKYQFHKEHGSLSSFFFEEDSLSSYFFKRGSLSSLFA